MPVLYEYNSVFENVNLARKLGFDFIELNLNFEYCRKALEKPEELKKILEENNLEATLHFYDEADFGSYKEVVDAYMLLLKKYAKLGMIAKIKMINIHLNPGPIVTIAGVKNYIYEKEYNSYIERLINRLDEAREICHDNKIEMVLENVIAPKHIQKTYVDLSEKSFFFNYDIGHDNNDNDHVMEVMKKTKLVLKEFHIHDANRKTCHLALGEGDLDIKKYMKMAEESDAYVVLEVKSSQDLISSKLVF